MKGKPVKHKTANTFRFIPFAERINAIDIRHAALYHIEHEYTEYPAENETHFHFAIRKWNVLNLTDSYKKFRKEVGGIITLAQLLHRKEFVLQTLETFLQLQDPLSLQPLLEILVSLAKDLRDDFYEYFPRFLDVLVKLLDTKDADRLEWALVCLAFLFKILKPYLKKDISVVLKRIIPLLSETHPQYINNFAAESFAFVTRDIRDKKKFIQLVLNYLQCHEDAISGCGHLIFEIIRGVNGKFHSCIETYLPLLLQHLKDKKEHQDILFKVLTQTLTDSLQTISPKEYALFWDGILKYTEEILSDNNDESKGLEYILRLAGQVIEHQNGKYLTNPPQFVLLLIKVVCEQYSESVLSVCAQIGALLLLSPNVSLSQEHAGIIVKVLLPLPFPNILISFVQNVIKYPQFDMHILPHFLNFVFQSNFETEAMHTLARVCISKAPLSKNGINLFDWVKYPIDFGKGLPLLMKHLDEVLNVNQIENIIDDPVKYINALVCMPHVEKIDVGHCTKLLSKFIEKLLCMLSKYNLENSENNSHSDVLPVSKLIRRVLFLLGLAIESVIHVSSCNKLNEICEADKLLSILLPCAADPNYLAALQIVDLYLTAYGHENKLSYPFLLLVDSYLKDNVRSPFHAVRLLTTHIYKLFENIDEINKSVELGSNVETLSVFSLCYKVESIKPSIQEYRTQLSLLQSMEFNTPQYNLLKTTEFHMYALNYMLGILNANFKLLWEPTIEYIAGYANMLNADDFWPTFHRALDTSFANARKARRQFVFDSEFNTNYDILNTLHSDYNNILENPDLFHYRNLLLKVMTNCIEVCELKNHDVAVIFNDFIETEYKRSDNTNALKTDVEIHVDNDELQESEEIMDIEPPIDDMDESQTSVNGKIIFKTLINIMQVLSQFKNPRAIHKESTFWDYYMEFLKHKNPGLQKYALDCVLNYKNKSVICYKNNLHNLVDENKFKEEMTLFKITQDSDTLRFEDREHVIPIIIRILYGKMTTKLGANKKGGGQSRRALVMRYIAGCNESELKMFIDMAFSHFKHYMGLNPKEIYMEVVNDLNLKSIISPGKLHSVLNLFEVVREYFAGNMKDELVSGFYKILYAVCSTVSAVLSQSDKVHIGYLKVMKNLRAIALSIVRKLFEQFDRYTWHKDELYVLFETLIWPTLPKLHIEGIHSPTILLKLINTWCLNPRYYILLITHSHDEPTLSPIPAIFKLLQSPKITVAVVNMILDMIEKLLLLTEDEEDKQLPRIESFNVLPIGGSELSGINFGSKILIPHIPNILEVMKRRVTNSAKSNSVNKRDLFILSRITELVTTPEMCDELLHLLLPILVKKICMNMAEENMEYAVNTIINLLGHSTNPQKYLKNISVLFNKISPVDVRKLLCQLLTSIANNSISNKDTMLRVATVVNEMNAFNARWIEQPDFDRRIDAYKEIYQLLEKNEIDVDLAILIVNNCFYFIRTEKDIGLRDSAALCLKRILPKTLLKHKSTSEGLFLIRDTVLSLISNGIRDTKNEILRNESIALLGDLARECPEADVVFTDLSILTNKEDREVDFFDNMGHLQMHRRVRALTKFCKVFRKVQNPPVPRTLTNFILPLASMYLYDEKYSDKNSLIDAAIDVVSTCCRLLPWYHYEVILKYYLNKIRHSTDHQKQLTRILIGILDTFHFDFSKIKNIEIPAALITNMYKHSAKKINKNTKDTKLDTKKKIESEKEIESEKKTEPENVDNMEVDDVKDQDDGEQDEIEDIESELKAADVEAETEEDLNKTAQDLPAYERITSVSPSVGKRIIRSLTTGLLLQLNRAIGKMTDHDESHKINRRRMGLERQEEDMLRVPIALALVKLLQRLPGDLLKYNLPGIIIKLCSFLKSPLKQVRISARDIVKKIMITVGSSYLGVLFEHLTLLLTRGFQVHVLVATIHTVLDSLKTEFKSGELDGNLHYILNVCTNDLFGALSEEKEVDKLHYKTPEAKPSKKSFVTLMIAAQNITDKCLIDIIVPFKEVLQKHHSKKIILKVQEALTHITTGLVTNRFIKTESLFVFLHGIASQSIPEFVLGAPKREITNQQREKMLRANPDCFIIPETPKRNREVQAKNVKTSAKANSHVLVEFSLNILYVILKREKMPKMECRTFVDPLIPLLVDSLRSDHVKVTTVALKCFTSIWTTRLVTPTLEESIKEIVQALFCILHKYATFEISKQNDNYHLVRNAFKAVTVLTRNVKYYTMEADQLKTLLLYAEEDCQNNERQANCFSLLKAILEAKLVSPELHEVMEKISKICILSDSAKSREEARIIFLNYLTDYPLGKRLERHIKFFVSQLQYELKHGRESSLRFLQMIITKLPTPQLSRHSGFLLLSLGAAMVNDSDPDCRQSAANCLEVLLRKFTALERNNLFDLVLVYFNQDDRDPSHYELAAQLCTRFVVVEEDDFKSRLDKMLDIITSKMYQLSNHGSFVKLHHDDEENEDEESQKEKDHCLIQMLNLSLKITTLCPSSLTKKKFINKYDDLAQECQTLLAHPHLWVRLNAAKIINQMFLHNINANELDALVREGKTSDRGFVYYDTENRLRSLVLDLCAQYTATISKEMSEQVTELIFQIIKLVHSMSCFKLKSKNAPDYEEMENSKLNMRWIIFKLRKAINVEVSKAPLSSNIRSTIFTMWMHLISLLELDDLGQVVDLMVTPVVRELATGDAMAPASLVKQLASRVGKKLRRKIGDIEYSKLAAEAQTRLNVRRAERKKVILQEKVNNPEKAAKRKLLMKDKKRQAKKIKLEMLKGKRPRPKKRKAEDIDLEDALLD